MSEGINQRLNYQDKSIDSIESKLARLQTDMVDVRINVTQIRQIVEHMKIDAKHTRDSIKWYEHALFKFLLTIITSGGVAATLVKVIGIK